MRVRILPRGAIATLLVLCALSVSLAVPASASGSTYGVNFSGGSYGFDDPSAIAFDGTHLWVPNYADNSVTEFNASDGSWIQTISGGSFGFDGPSGITFDGTHVWVTNALDGSVTEFNASDGSWVQTLSGGSY